MLTRGAGIFRGFFRAVGSVFSRLAELTRRRFTIMLIPHSERKGLNFQLNAFVLAGIVAVLLLGMLGFFYYATIYTGNVRLASSRARDLESSEQQLDSLVNEIAEVLRVAQLFDQTLQQTAERLGTAREVASDGQRIGSGDLSEIRGIQEIEPGQLPEVRELQSVAALLGTSVEPLSQIRSLLQERKALLADLPNLWPVAGGRGRITRRFGPNIHPITNEWFLSRGVVITDSLGVPVVASANGKVTELGFDPNYGLYVWVRHKYGFRTRYSHLQTITVIEGQEVFQGQRIGTLGSSGVATSPNLDFQIWLGTDVVDPAAFLQIAHSPVRVRASSR